MKKNIKKGFSLLELVISISILAVIIFLGFFYFPKDQDQKILDREVQNFIVLLEQAKSLAVSSKGASVYSVFVEQNKATLFSGTNYVSGESSNIEIIFKSPVFVSAINLNGGSQTITFDRLSGKTDDYGTVVFSIPTDSLNISKTVSILSSGVIQ